MASSVSLFDARPFFEKALVFGVQNGIIDAQKLDEIQTSAPKGMVQIARYFGTEFLRPELERAKDRIVNLVSLHLEDASGGDLAEAAGLLRDHSFLSRSKAGSDMLKSLIAMPQNSHFGMNDGRSFTDDHIPLLAKWTLKSLPDYQAELAKRSQVATVIDAAIWLADALGMDAAELEEAGKDAEAVIRTALLVLAAGRTEMPDWVAFDKLVTLLRTKAGAAIKTKPAKKVTQKATQEAAGVATAASSKDMPASMSVATPVPMPKNLPPEYHAVVQRVRQTVMVDLPKILDPALPTRKLFDQTPAFMGRYFWVEDALAEVDDFDRAVSDAWRKATGGHGDDSSLLTLFLTIAAGTAPKTLLTEKAAASLIRKIRKNNKGNGVSSVSSLGRDSQENPVGLNPELVRQYILANAPEQHQGDYTQLWQAFMEDAQATLQSDRDYELKDAMALLRRECNVK